MAISGQSPSAGVQSFPGVEPARVPTANAYATAALQGIADEEDRLPGKPLQWLVLMIVAMIVGAGAGVVGALFRMTLGAADRARTALAAHVHLAFPPWVSWVIPTCVCAAGAMIACYLTERLAPHTSGSGIPRVEAVLRHHLRPAEAWILPVKFIGGALSIGSGLALGREGPTVQMGGTFGRLVGDRLKKIVPEPWTLIAAGAGTGLAVAFNAPLAATLFVMEELLHRFSARVFSATLMACISGTVVLRFMLGNVQDLGGPQLTVLPADVLPGYLLLGALAGLVGVAFNMFLLRALRLFDRARDWPRGTKGAVVGGAAGLAAWFAPQFVGGGEGIAQIALMHRLAWTVVVSLLVGRFVFTMFSYGCGAPGGIFAPLLAVGALLGNAFAFGQSALLHLHSDPAPYAIVAMAACFTAIVRSPLTGVVLLLEMTGSWTLILPMMAASVTAYAVPELLGNPPIYDSLREREEAMERARVPEVPQVRPEPPIDEGRVHAGLFSR